MKTCTRCGQEKPADAFRTNGMQCKTCLAAAYKAYYAANADRLREYQRQYKRDHKDKVNASNRAWRAKNNDLAVGYNRTWRASKPDAMRHFAAQRRARIAAVGVQAFTSDDLAAYYAVMGWDCCIYCGAPYEQDDHIVPIARGGKHELLNMAPSCASCNRSKNDRLLAEWLGFTDRRTSRIYVGIR